MCVCIYLNQFFKNILSYFSTYIDKNKETENENKKKKEEKYNNQLHFI